MAQGKRQVRGRREGQDRSRELFEICLAQRRADARGKRLRTFDLDELAGMSANELARVRANGWLSLPDLITPHAPPCSCDGCEAARESWRAKTGLE